MKPYPLPRAARCANCGESLAAGSLGYVTRDGRSWCPAVHGCAPPLADRMTENESRALTYDPVASLARQGYGGDGDG